MTLSEFKAWLDGFSASFKDGSPSKEQWEVISGKLSRITAVRIDAPAPQSFPPIGKPWLGDVPIRTWYSH